MIRAFPIVDDRGGRSWRWWMEKREEERNHARKQEETNFEMKDLNSITGSLEQSREEERGDKF